MLLGVGLASTAMTEPLRCTAREELVLKRLVATCRGGTRAIGRGDGDLKRWHSCITPAPRKDPGSRPRCRLGQEGSRR
jgi:hypothetical protein